MTKKQFNPIIDFLENIHQIPELEKEYFVSILSHKTLAKGSSFLRAGEQADKIGFLVKGLIRYYHIAENGKEFTKHFCFDNHFVSSYSSAKTGEASNYFIDAIEETQLITFSYDDWEHLLKRHWVWGVLNDHIQSYALILAEKRERSLIMDDAETRYLNLLSEIPEIELRVKQYDLANYLGITAVALSRIKSRISKK